MGHSNAELHRRVAAAFDTGDVDTIAELTAEDCVWYIPGDHELSGAHRGRDAVLKVYAKLGEITGGTLRADRIDVLASDERSFDLAHFTARREDGRELDTMIGSILRWRDGKVVENHTVPLDPEAFFAFHA